MKRNSIFKVLPFLVFSMLGVFSSCNNNLNGGEVGNQTETEKTELGRALLKGFEENENKDFFVVVDQSDNEYLVFTEDEYYAAHAFSILVSKEKTRAGDPDANEGWIKEGEGKNNIDALKIAHRIAKKVGKDQNFEIHVERDKDKGTYTVWYRIIE